MLNEDVFNELLAKYASNLCDYVDYANLYESHCLSGQEADGKFTDLLDAVDNAKAKLKDYVFEKE